MCVCSPFRQVDLQSLEREKKRLQLALQRSQSLVHENPELQRTQQNCPEDDLRVGINDIIIMIIIKC